METIVAERMYHGNNPYLDSFYSANPPIKDTSTERDCTSRQCALAREPGIAWMTGSASMLQPNLILIWLSLTLLYGASGSSVDHSQSLTRWLVEKGGFWHESLEVRPTEDGDYGIFAAKNIPSGTKLFTIPQSIKYVGKGEDPDVCETAISLWKDFRRLDQSEKVSPYIQFLRNQPRGRIPSDWSGAGKKLIQDILGMELPARGMVDMSFSDECGDIEEIVNESDQDLLESAYMLVIQRGWGELMLPVYDLLHHSSGKNVNTENDSVYNDEIVVSSTRIVTTGERLYTTYDDCVDCNIVKEAYGTPEKFRDYGFVEDFPQRWTFPMADFDFNLAAQLEKDGEEAAVVTWLDAGHEEEYCVRVLMGQLERLKAFDFAGSTAEGVPEQELISARLYHESLTYAMNVIIHEALSMHDDNLENISEDCFIESDGTQSCTDKARIYDALDGKNQTELNFETYPCYIGRAIPFPGYRTIDEGKSQYQSIDFFQHPETLDTCFRLDTTVQICSSYRPHYHELFVHYTSSYFEKVKRVVFVGGGDSMLLHEILKYPSLELVVGLEIDQKVTRDSFLHFGTQPHWDNTKVEWWFGDAAKSLLMLPKDYFGTFDMALVDLSETVTSMLVTDGLDIFSALGLLLQPEGILVKNELYFDQMGSIFEYSIQAAFWDVPVICYQALSFGSPKRDFLSSPLINHGVDTLVYNQRQESADRFGITHNFRHNRTGTMKQHCLEPGAKPKIPEKQESSPGILMILEAEGVEKTVIHSTENLRKTVEAALAVEGMTLVAVVGSTAENIQSGTVFVLGEGYVIARCLPEKTYCAFDIMVWSRFEKHALLRASLLSAVKASSFSSYRIVTGGMFGVVTWQEDEKNRGPKFLECSSDQESSDFDGKTETNSIERDILSQSLKLMPEKWNGLVLVVCGSEEEFFANMTDSSFSTLVIGSCAEASSTPNSNMIECERNIWTLLVEAVGTYGKISAVVLDPSAEKTTSQVLIKILRSFTKRTLVLNASFIGLAAGLGDHSWRKYFLQSLHRDVMVYDPAFFGVVRFVNTETNIEMGVVLSGEKHFVQLLREALLDIERRTGLTALVDDVANGLWQYMTEFKPSQYALPSAYNQSAPLEQWRSQRPVGSQSVLQFELQHVRRVEANFEGDGEFFPGIVQTDNEDDTYDILYDDGDFEAGVPSKLIRFLDPKEPPPVDIGTLLKEALRSTSLGTDLTLKEHTIGEGYLLVITWSACSAVLVWDGRNHVDLNLFTAASQDPVHASLPKHLEETVSKLKLVLRDEQPRGFGRVVNFADDFEPDVDPHWA